MLVHLVFVELVVVLQLQWGVLHNLAYEVLDNYFSCAQVRDKLNIFFYGHLASFGCYLSSIPKLSAFSSSLVSLATFFYVVVRYQGRQLFPIKGDH